MKLDPSDFSPTLLRELRDWARAGGEIYLAHDCSIALQPADHRPEVVADALARCADAWNARVAENATAPEDVPTQPRVITRDTEPIAKQTIAEVDAEWRAERKQS